MIKITALLLAVCLPLSGCVSIRSNPDTLPDSSTAISGENQYYDFILSEMENQAGHADLATEYMKRAVAAQPKSLFLKKELVYLYLQNDDTDNALKTIEEILADYPEDIGSLIMAGTIKKQAGQEEEAASIFEKILALNPKKEKIYHLLGEYYLENNDLAKAAGVYEKMTEQLPDLWEGFFFLGKIQIRQGKFVEAEKDFRHCLKLEKSLVSPRFELITLYKKQALVSTEVTVQPGDTVPDLCRKYYRYYNNALAQKIIAANPDIKDISALKAGQKLTLPESTEKCDMACQKKIIGLYNSILNDYPDNYRAAMELALYYYSIGKQKKGDKLLTDLGRKSESAGQYIMQTLSQYFIGRQKFEDTRTILTGLLRGAPNNAGLHYLLGIIYDKQEQKTEALDQFAQVKEDSTFYPSALLQMAFLYEEAKQPEKAEEIFDQLLEKEPDKTDLMLYAGSFMERQEKYEQAEALYKRGLSIEPENVDLLFRLGVIYDKTGQKEAVIQQMKKIIELAPDDANALNYLGYTYADMGVNLDEAQQLIEKALKIEPDNGYITDSLGWVFYQKGEIKKAIETLTLAVELFPDDSILLEHLGDAYLKDGQTEQALDAYQRGLKFAKDPDKETINQKIQDLLQSTGKP